MKYYKVKRYLIEEFAVEASTRPEAIKAMRNDEHGGPGNIIVIKETYIPVINPIN